MLRKFAQCIIWAAGLAAAAAGQTGLWQDTGHLSRAAAQHTATLLPSGKVLVLAGFSSETDFSKVGQIYDPATGTWTTTAGDLSEAKFSTSATLLPSGKVLVVGGPKTVELYDPETDTFEYRSTLDSYDGCTQGRWEHTATLLSTGEVLIVGGRGPDDCGFKSTLLCSQDGHCRLMSALDGPRWGHTATLLPSGKVLVVGGIYRNEEGKIEGFLSVDLLDPADPEPTWRRYEGVLNQERSYFTATLLTQGEMQGKVLVAGGEYYGILDSVELIAPNDLKDGYKAEMADPLNTGRTRHNATLLPSGEVLVSGGYVAGNGGSSFDAEPEIYAGGSWNPVSAVGYPEVADLSATLLPSGKVLIAGGTGLGESTSGGERYFDEKNRVVVFDPLAVVSKSANPEESLPARRKHTMNLLPSGEAIVVGGESNGSPVKEALLYDSTNGVWTPLVDGPELSGHTATLLSSGKLLVVGGTRGGKGVRDVYTYTQSGGWMADAGSLNEGRHQHTATLLPDGRVLVVGGFYEDASDSGDARSTAEIYDPQSNNWQKKPFRVERGCHTATLLLDGRVLIAGGKHLQIRVQTVELFDSRSGEVFLTGALNEERCGHAAILLPSGKVLVAGGGPSSAEIFDPDTEHWSLVEAPLNTAVAATTLPTGEALFLGNPSADVLMTATYDPATAVDLASQGWALMNAELSMADPALARLTTGEILAVGSLDGNLRVQTLMPHPESASRPLISSVTSTTVTPNGETLQIPDVIRYGAPLHIEGSGFRDPPEGGGGNYQSSHGNFPMVRLHSLENRIGAWLTPDTQADNALRVSRIPPIFNPGWHFLTVFNHGVPSESKLVLFECSLGNDAPVLTAVNGLTEVDGAEVGPATKLRIGDEATFSLHTEGARFFQWQQCQGAWCADEDDPETASVQEDGDWEEIQSATASSYTTPPIQGPESGTRFRVVAQSGCKSVTSMAVELQVEDDIPPGCTDSLDPCTAADPPVAVVTPNGGELWPLSTEEEPSVEAISWTMSDNIRICQVTVDLLFSEDGGSRFDRVPDPYRPRVFGDGGTCRHPGVETTSFDYTIPTEPPSGKPGSLYKVEVEVTDHAGNSKVVRSERAFYIVEPNDNSVKTLIVWNSQRMADLGMATDNLSIDLQNLAAHRTVAGRVVDLARRPDIQGLYEAWDNGEVDANDLLFREDGIHDYLNKNWLATFTGVEYLVLVGDDRVIPLARIQDDTPVPVSEKAYPDDPDDVNHPMNGDLTKDGTRAGRSLADGNYLSDDPLATVGPLSKDDLDDDVFLPDLAVGRLVETPGEISASIATFLSQQGVLDLTAAERPNKVLVSAYDFLVDGGNKIRDRWKTALSAGVEDGALIGQDWTSDDLKGRLCPASDPYGALSLNGHGTHYEIGSPSGDAYEIQGLPTDEIDNESADDVCLLPGGVVYAVGCHSGLTVAGTQRPGDHPQDLPQTMMRAGAMAYLGNTGYGWGLTHGIGYSERLVEIFTEELVAQDTVALGDAVRFTKKRFFDESPRFDAYDEKVSMQWTLYGFPMYTLKTRNAAKASAPRRLFEGPPPRLEDLPERESFGPVVVERQSLESTFVDGVLLTPPPYLTRLNLLFDFSAQGVYKLFNAAGTEVPSPTSTADCDARKADPDPYDDVPQGCYYTLNNIANGDDLATGETDRPLQPLFVYDSRLSGTSFHGFLWKGGTYVEEENWKPLVATLQSNVEYELENGDPLPEVSKSNGKGKVRKGATGGECDAADTDVSSLVLETGELLHLDEDFVERHYETVDVELLYFNDTSNPDANCDRAGPELSAVHQVVGSTVDWTVEASDPAGVWRVLVVWNDGQVETGTDGKARGRWQPLELELVDGAWRGSVQVTGSSQLSYFVQAVDKRGNVSLPLLQEAEVPPSGVPRDFTEVDEVNLASADADLAVALTAPFAVHGLETLTARVDVTNLGPDTASGVQVTADLPGMTGVHGSGFGWTCLAEPEKLTCTYAVAQPGPLPALTIGGTAPPNGRVTLVATVSALSTDAVTANDSASASVFVLAAPEADLAVTQEVTDASDGRSPVFTITVTNAGPNAVTGATVRDVLPGELASVGWSCEPSAGAFCTAAGAGDVVDFVTLPADGWVRYTVSSVLEAGFVGSLTNTATVTAPSGVYDPALASNSSTVTLDYGGAIFADGFESGDVTAWSAAVGEVP